MLTSRVSEPSTKSRTMRSLYGGLPVTFSIQSPKVPSWASRIWLGIERISERLQPAGSDAPRSMFSTACWGYGLVRWDLRKAMVPRSKAMRRALMKIFFMDWVKWP